MRLILIIAFIVALSSCKKENGLPDIDFEYVVDGLNVEFTSNIPGATSVLWDFGDHDTSRAQNPRHHYNYGGLYNVKLTVTTSKGTVSKVKEVRIATPTSAFINRLQVLAYDTSKTWDSVDGPDIYIRLIKQADTSKTSVIPNVLPAHLPFSWELTPAWELKSSPYAYSMTLSLFDEDASFQDTNMGGFIFGYSYLAGLGHPEEVVLELPVVAAKLKMFLEWK
jgi:hypothetical protein